MNKNEVRLQYSGFVIFAAKMLSVATGIIFILLITRNATQPELGIWSNVFDLMGYFMLFSAAVPFWTTRFLARGEEGTARTGFLANLIISLISVAFYIPLVPLITSSLGIGTVYLAVYLIASLQIVEVHLIGALEACLRVAKPQAVGYGLLIEEISKISLAYTLIVIFRQPLLGAIISLVVAVVIQIAYYIRLMAADFRQKIQWGFVREWLKGSTVSVYNLVGNQIAAFVFILLFVYGGQGARGNYAAAAAIANIITYSFFLSFALYPRLLAEKGLQDITTSLRLVLMFAVPMTVGAMALPDSFLIILAEPYKEAAPVLFFLAIDSLILTISLFYTNVLFGVEKLDEKAKIPLKELAKSDIFKVFTLPYVHAAITLPLTFYVLTNFVGNQPVWAGVHVTVINMIARLAMFLVLCVITRRAVRVQVPWKSLGKYVFASAVFAVVLYVLPHPTRLVQTLGTAAMGGGIYLAILALIDKETRQLLFAIWIEIRGKMGRRA